VEKPLPPKPLNRSCYNSLKVRVVLLTNFGLDLLTGFEEVEPKTHKNTNTEVEKTT